MENLNTLVEILNSELSKKTSQEWLKIFDEEGLPCGPINTILDMHIDSQAIHRKMIIDVKNKKAGKSKAIGMPIKFSNTNNEKFIGSPTLGEHTNQILEEFGFTIKDIDKFKKNKVII